MSKDQDLEKEIVAAGANIAPRITPADIEANIISEWYFTAGDGVLGASIGASAMGTRVFGVADSLNRLTFCVLVLRNGFTVTGESACASPKNYNKAIGERIARENAISKIWPLMGYDLKQRLHDAEVLQRALVDDDHPLHRA